MIQRIKDELNKERWWLPVFGITVCAVAEAFPTALMWQGNVGGKIVAVMFGVFDLFIWSLIPEAWEGSKPNKWH